MIWAALAGLAYAVLASLPWRAGPWPEHLGTFWVVSAVAWVAMWRASRTALSARTVILAAVLFRLLLVPAAPSLSDDIYRYVWEGHVQRAGFDPYVLAPDNPALAPLRDATWALVNHREYTAIYPPLTQLVFRGLSMLGGVVVFKAAFALLDVLTVWLLIVALRRRHLPVARAVLYAWNPLALVEIAGSGHLEPLGLLPLVLAVVFVGERRARGWAAFALSVGAKYAAAAALPAFLFRARPGPRAAFTALVVLAVGYTAFLGAGPHLFDSLRAYAEHWRFNDFAFVWLGEHIADPLRARRTAAALVVVLSCVAAWRARTVEAGAIAAFLIALALAPTVHPWYVLWPLVLVPLVVSHAALVWSATVLLAYHFFHPVFGRPAAPQDDWNLRWIEMTPVLAALLFDVVAARRRPVASADSTASAVQSTPAIAVLPETVRIALIMPALDEEPSLPLVLADLEPLRRDRGRTAPAALLDEIVLVDNGSRDRTAEIARDAGLTVLRESERGYGAACLCALAHLRQRPPAVVLFMDADRSDDASEIPDLLRPILAGRADLVIGSRTRGRHEPGALLPQARFGNWLATGWIRAWYGFQYTDLGPFRAIRWEALEQIGMRDRDWGWTLEMQVRALQEGLRVTEIPVRYRRRVGQSKISGTILGSARAGRKILWTLWTLRRPGR